MNKIYILLFAAVLYSQFTYAQVEENTLTDYEYDQIKINDIPIGDVIDTRGDYMKLKAMFGDDLQYREYDLPNTSREFKNSKIFLLFQDEDYSLYNFIVYFPSTLTIKGRKVKVGGDVSALGLVLVNTSSDGEENVFFIDERTHTAGVTIEINPSTKKIKEIYYVLY